MIQITRLPEPSILTNNRANWTNELCNERRAYYQELDKYNNGALKEAPKYPKPKKGRYAHERVKKQLRTMSGPKCAYCESFVLGNSYLHVEHFRPSSIYPFLAYDWNNLLLACEVCNSGYKKAKFPLMDGSSPIENRNNPSLLDDSDDNALINPCTDPPENYFDFLDEELICNGIRAEQTRDVCGLNREDLKDERKIFLNLYELVINAYLYARENNDAPRIFRTKNDLKQILINPNTPFIAMLKSKITRMGIDINELLI